MKKDCREVFVNKKMSNRSTRTAMGIKREKRRRRRKSYASTANTIQDSGCRSSTKDLRFNNVSFGFDIRRRIWRIGNANIHTRGKSDMTYCREEAVLTQPSDLQTAPLYGGRLSSGILHS